MSIRTVAITVGSAVAGMTALALMGPVASDPVVHAVGDTAADATTTITVQAPAEAEETLIATGFWGAIPANDHDQTLVAQGWWSVVPATTELTRDQLAVAPRLFDPSGGMSQNATYRFAGLSDDL